MTRTSATVYRDPWQGKLYSTWTVECGGEGCRMKEELGSHMLHYTKASAARVLGTRGWVSVPRIGWLCPACIKDYRAAQEGRGGNAHAK